MTQPSSLKKVGAGYLWRFWFIAIAAWAIQLFIGYALVEWHCARPDTFNESILHWLIGMLTVLCVATVLVNLCYAIKYYRLLKKYKQTHSREIFMAAGASLMSGFLAVAIFVQGWPSLILPACQSVGG